MKSLFLTFLACFALFIPLVQGLSQGDIALTFDWSKNDYYQGDSGRVTISLNSTCINELEITWIGVHFAWMTENHYDVLDLSSNPVKIPSCGCCIFQDIKFSVSSNASVGWNGYYVRIHFNEHRLDGWTSGRVWTSLDNQIYIHDIYEREYNELRPQVLSKINASQSAYYESTDAKSLLSQAVYEYDLAASLADQEKWKDAVTHLQTTLNLLVQTSTKEEEYRYQEQELDTWRQKALDSINLAGEKINQLKDCENLGAKSLLQEAQIQFTNAQNSFNETTLQSYKDAYNFALQAGSYTDQAFPIEQEYQKEKQKTSNIISTAGQKISHIKDVEGTEAKQFLQQAQVELTDAENANNQKTITGCKTGYLSAQQAVSYADQASDIEQEYQEEKQKALSVIEMAEEKISQIEDAEIPDVQQLLQQAKNQLTDAKNAYNQKTIDGCRTAYSSAQQAMEYAEKAYPKYQTYQQQEQRQQQMTLIITGISALVVLAIVVTVFEFEREKLTIKPLLYNIKVLSRKLKEFSDKIK